MIVRRRGMPLLRGALIGGAGYAAGRSAANRAQHEAQQSQAIADLQSQQAPPPAPAAAAPDLADKLTQLGQLVQQGLLSPEEFATAKAKLLGG